MGLPPSTRCPLVVTGMGLSQDQFESMLATIQREGFFDLGPNEGDGVGTIDRSYALHDLGLDGLDLEQDG